eukprot:GHVT01088659.1.p1 GENE.GHVT01088659.1~~GHVT01088659.1.p1  ORF type:complete len:155 (-),score=5.58 GHVT01088659.1:349-813(-)
MRPSTCSVAISIISVYLEIVLSTYTPVRRCLLHREQTTGRYLWSEAPTVCHLCQTSNSLFPWYTAACTTRCVLHPIPVVQQSRTASTSIRLAGAPPTRLDGHGQRFKRRDDAGNNSVLGRKILTQSKRPARPENSQKAYTSIQAGSTDVAGGVD